MDIFEQLSSSIPGIFKISWMIFFNYYGWVLFLIGMIYVLWRMYYVEIQHQFMHNQQWVFLDIKVPADNKASTLAIDNMFSAMHALHRSYTFLQKYVEGGGQLNYSLELVSLGGKISYIIRVPKSFRNLLEAALYAHYPAAEITEVEDYLKNIEYDPENSPLEVLGTEYKLVDNFVIPLKSYKDFEHPAAEEKIIDPLNHIYEALSKAKPSEILAIQILISPLGDEEWKPKGEAKIAELIGAEQKHDVTISGLLLSPFTKFASFSFKESLAGGHHAHVEKTQKNDWMSLTEGEKLRVSLIENKIGKPGYKTKIRFLYLAPKEIIDKNKRYVVVGGFRPLGSAMNNRLKPDSGTWVGVDPIISEGLEKPYLDWKLKKLKKRHFKGFKQRDTHLGASPFILNTEEIATLYHFPITGEARSIPSNISRTESKKSQPPANLPVAEDVEV